MSKSSPRTGKNNKMDQNEKHDNEATQKSVDLDNNDFSDYGDPNFYFSEGEFNYPNGDRYIGGYCAHFSGKIWKEGLGVYHTKDGQSYDGKWYNDRLEENCPVKITFKNGDKFTGWLKNCKYNSAGCYSVVGENGDLNLVVEFVDNKPVGDLILLDTQGFPWYGKVDNDRAVLQQENIYYQNIPDTRGIGKSRYKSTISKKSSNLATPASEETVNLKELEKQAFKKNTKIEEGYDFEHSAWYSNYLSFKKKQQIIMCKVKKMKEALNDEEQDWYLKYCNFKDRYNKILSNRRSSKANDSVDFAMLYEFFDEEYMKSVPEKVIYPSQNDKNDIL